MTGAGQFVEYGRWDEAHRALMARVLTLENELHDMRGGAGDRAALASRVAALEEAAAAEHTEQAGRRNRRWAIAIAAATGIVCPLIVTTILAWIHLRAVH